MSLVWSEAASNQADGPLMSARQSNYWKWDVTSWGSATFASADLSLDEYNPHMELSAPISKMGGQEEAWLTANQVVSSFEELEE